MHILLRMVQDMEVHLLTHILIVKGAVPVGEHIPQLPAEALASGREVSPVVLLLPLVHVPHLQEEHGQALDRVPPQHDSRVLPVAEPLLPVDVLVPQIDASREAHPAVNDAYLAVVPVVLHRGQEGLDGVHHLAADPLSLQLLRVFIGQVGDGAGAVVHEAHLYPLPRLLHEDLQDSVPHVALLHDKVFHKNILPGLLQLGDKGLEFVLAQRKIGHLRVAVCGKSHVMGQVVGQIRIGRLAGPQRVHHVHVLHHVGICLYLQGGQSLSHPPDAHLRLHVYIEQRAYRGKRHDTEHPRHLKGRVPFRIDDIDQHDDAQHPQDAVYKKRIGLQQVCCHHKNTKLYQDEQENESCTAEYDPGKP